MSISIHQITCGERDKSWQLLNSTLPDNDTARKVAFQCDLQDSPPSGIQWSPSIRGFFYGDQYLIMKTYLDPSPGMRTGRAFSHCLVIGKDDLLSLADIAPLFGLFEAEVNKAKELHVIEYSTSDSVVCPSTCPIENRFNKVIQGFLKGDPYKAILWVNGSDFETAVCKFWKLLSPEQRWHFNFGMNFNPAAINEGRINFIAVPESLINKFENKNYLIVNKDDTAKLTAFGEKFIAGHADAILQLELFVSAMEAGNVSRNDLPVIAKGLPAFEELDSLEDIKKLNLLANIIAKFSPDATAGKELKDRLCQRMAIAISNARETDILVLKVFPFDTFSVGAEKIGKSIDRWLKNNLFDLPVNSKGSFAELLAIGLDQKNTSWLTQRIMENVAGFLRTISGKQFSIVFTWMESDHKIVPVLFQKILASGKDEQSYTDQYTALKSEKSLKAIKEASVKSGWFSMLATVLKHEYEPAKAIEELIRYDNDPSSLNGINILIADIAAPDIVKIAINTSDERMIVIAARSALSNSGIFDTVDIKKASGQKLWIASSRCNGIATGFSDPQQKVYAFLDSIVAGKQYDPVMLDIISREKYADLLNYPRRNELWPFLTGAIRETFLRETSTSLLESLSSNSAVEIPEDAVLSKYILDKAINTFLYYNRSNIKSTLPVFQKFQMPHWYLRDFITNYEDKIDIADAIQLGNLVMEMKSSECAYALYRKAGNTKSFRPAVKISYHLLEFIERGHVATWGWISHMEVSENEWWDAFITLSCKLYPQGPMQYGLWTAADGEESVLLHNAPGRDIWVDALRQLRYGGTEDLTATRLIKQMLKRFSKNEELKTMKYLWKSMNQE